MKSYVTNLKEEIKRLRKENKELQLKNGEWARIAVESNFELDLLKADYEDARRANEELRSFIINNFIDNKNLEK